MRILFYSLIILGFAILFGLFLHQNPGYVLLHYSDLTVEMPLWLFVLALSMVFFGLALCLKFIRSLFSTPRYLRELQLRQKRQKAIANMRKGFIALVEGHWSDAEKLLTKSANALPNSLLSYLGAAICAQRLGALDRRDNYLRLAHTTGHDSKMAVSLTQARLQIEQGQLEQGLATLQLLRQLSPKHDYVLTLLKDVYTSLGEWGALLELVDKMKSRKLISLEEAQKLQTLAYSMLLKKSAAQNLEHLTQTWKGIDRHLKANPELVQNYIALLLGLKEYTLAAQTVTQTLKKQWDESLVRQLGLIPLRDSLNILQEAQNWVKYHPESAMLHLTLGRLSVQNQLWGKAQTFFKKSLELCPSVECYLELIHLDNLDNQTAAYSTQNKTYVIEALKLLTQS